MKKQRFAFYCCAVLLCAIMAHGSNVITMKTTKQPGQEIKLRMKAAGEVAVDGAELTTPADQKERIYKLSSSTVTITGDVTMLDCSENGINSLDVSGNKALQMLTCSWNALDTLNLSQNTSLEYLSCGYNTIAHLDVTKNSSLKVLNCFCNHMKSLTLPQNSNALNVVDCSINDLKSLDFSNLPMLNFVSCFRNELKGEAMGIMIASLTDRSQINNIMGDLNIYADTEPGNPDKNVCTKLQVEQAVARFWQPKTFDMEKMEWVNYAGTEAPSTIKLTTAKNAGETVKFLITANGDYMVDGATFKGKVTEYGETLSEYTLNKQSLTITGDVTIFGCGYNKVTTIDVSQNAMLKELDCSYNSIQELNVSKNPQLEFLNCYSNQLSNLSLSANQKLKYLDCHSNKLTSISLENCTKLEELDCSNNAFNDNGLNLSKNTSLTYLYCQGNGLKALSLAGNKKLASLFCASNALQALDLTANVALQTLGCSKNNINGQNMDNMIASLCDRSNETKKGKLYVFDDTPEDIQEQNVCTTVQVDAAKSKGWLAKRYNPNEMTWDDYEGSASAVNALHNDALEVVAIYNIMGHRHTQLQPGVNIVKMSDGSTRKIYNLNN